MIASRWGVTPRQSIEALCRQRGTKTVVANCVDILSNRGVDEETLLALAGPAAEQVLQGREGGLDGYWPRVWAMRGFLYAWNETAVPVVIAGAADPHWRVREMSAKVVARHQVADAVDAMAGLLEDSVPRVRSAADRALMRLAEYGV
jgi:HEAT repeat protein